MSFEERHSSRIDSSPESAEEARRGDYTHHHRHGVGEKRRIGDLEDLGGAGPAVKRINVNIGKQRSRGMQKVCTAISHTNEPCTQH